MREILSLVERGDTSEAILQRGRNLLERYVPAFVPKQPTVLIVQPSIDKTGGNMAIYYGMLRNSHYMFLGQDDPMMSSALESLIICHELVHQWHAEHMGPTLWWMVESDPDSYISDEEFETQPIYDLLEKLRLANGFGDTIFLSDALTEGLAMFIEFYVFEQYLKKSAHGDYRVLRELKALKRSPVFDLNYEEPDPHSNMGFKVVWEIYLNSGLNGVMDFIKSVDYERCNAVMDGTKKYFKMLAHPERIPLLTHPTAIRPKVLPVRAFE